MYYLWFGVLGGLFAVKVFNIDFRANQKRFYEILITKDLDISVLFM